MGRAARDSPPPPPGGVPPARHGCTCAGPRARAPRSGPRRSPQPHASGCRPSRTQSGCRKRSFIHYLRALIGLGRADWGRRRGRRGDPSGPGRVRTCGKVCGAGVGRAQTLSSAGAHLAKRGEGAIGPHFPPCTAFAAASLTQPWPHLSSSLVKWSVQGTAASLG